MTYRAIEWSLAALALAGCVEKHAFVADDGPLPVPPGTTGVSVAGCFPNIGDILRK